MTTSPLPTLESTSTPRPECRSGGPLARVVAVSVSVGAVGAALVPSVLLPGAQEHTTTGALLVAFAVGWAVLDVLTARLTAFPQRWARVPAAALALSGVVLLALAPGDEALQTVGWVWPPLLLALTGWTLVQLRRTMRSRTRWLLYPVLAALALASVGGLLQTVAERELRTGAAPGELVDVGSGRRLHLECAGSGSPTVVLHNGLGGDSAGWTRVVGATSATTRVCAYDRAGQGWSDPADQPQDSDAVVGDLDRLLARAGERGPFVLAGHSAGGAYAMAYAAQHPDDVAGLVLLDSMTPEQFTALPDFPQVHARTRRLYGLAPTVTRVGVGQLARALWPPELPGRAGAHSLAVQASPRGWRAAREEHAVYRRALAQAGALTTFGGKPLVVISSTESLDGTRGWRDAQAELARLSTNASARTVESAHAGVITEEAAAQRASEAILDTADSVRTGTPLPPAS